MQTRPTWNKAAFFGIILSVNKTHVLGHAISVEVRRSECLLRNHPTRREDNEISNGCTRGIRSDGQDGEDRRVLRYCVELNREEYVEKSQSVSRNKQYYEYRMIKRDRVYGIELAQVVFERTVVTRPCDDVKRRMIHLSSPELSKVFVDERIF